MIIERPERWSPSKRGVSAIVEELDDVIRFGLMTFPSRAGDDQNAGGQHRNCMPGDVDVAPADNNAGAITGLLNPMQAGGRTPTAVTLQRALAALDEGRAPDQGPIRPKYVMLVTDGSPNCRNNDPNSGNGAGGDPMEVTASVNAISALAEAGIPTYVLGFGTQNNNTLASVLDRMAEAGDTGDTAHRPIEDEASLVREFEQIAGGAVTCDYVLDNKVVDVKYVRVELDGMLLNYNDENGWRLREDARTVTLQGTACETLRGAGDHTFSVVVQCIELF